MIKKENIFFQDSTKPSYKICNGDCIDILKQIPDQSLDLIFADPPYNLQLQKELYRPNQTKVEGVNDTWDKFESMQDYDLFTKKWLTECHRVMKNTSTIWVIGSYHNIFRVGTIMLDLGFWVLNDIQWYKTNPMPNFRGVRFTNATETLIWAKKSKHQKKYTFNYQVMKKLNADKQMTSVWKIPLCTGLERIKNKEGKKAHSTQKPEELLKRVILSSSNEGDLVLDPFLGSGTTSAMCRKLNRRSVGIEREPSYCEIAKKRVQSIKIDAFQNIRLVEPSKKRIIPVSMEQLIKTDYIRENQIIYTKNKRQTATILADGKLRNGVGTGSIHKIGAVIKNSESCNGWLYWYYEDNGLLKMLDEKRKEYRKQYGLL